MRSQTLILFGLMCEGKQISHIERVEDIKRGSLCRIQGAETSLRVFAYSVAFSCSSMPDEALIKFVVAANLSMH